MRALLLMCLLLPGLSQAMDYSLDPSKIEFAKPWTKGKNVCAYIKRPGLLKHVLWSYCLPWKQDFCGAVSDFKYDCCPGFKNTTAFSKKPICAERERTWKTIPGLLWARGRRLFARLLIHPKKGAGHKPLMKSKTETNTHTVFAPYSDSVIKKGDVKFNTFNGKGKNHPVLFSVTQGRLYSNQFRNGMVLKSEFKGQKLKITKYSNGIICIECKAFVEPDHEAQNGVVHYISGVMTPFSGAGKGRNSLLQLLLSEPSTRIFARSLTPKLRALLGSTSAERQWFTIFAPSNKAFVNAVKKYGRKSAEELIKTHMLRQLYCSAALIGNDQDLGLSDSGEPIRVTCTGKGIRSVSTRFGPPVNVTKPDLMANNGVVHVVDGVLVPSAVKSLKEIVNSTDLPRLIGSSPWKTALKECDLRMEKSKKYAVLIPNQRAFDWWEKYPRFKKDFQKFLTDKKFRCRLARFHIAAMRGGKESTLPFLFQQQSGYRTNNVDKQFEVDYFRKRDYGPELFFHYSPIAPFKSMKFKQGSIYITDRVNTIPDKRLVDILKERKDLSTMGKMTKAAKMDATVFKKKEPLNLYLVIRNKGFQGNSKTAKDSRKYKGKSLKNFCLLHWVNNWLWGGDIGYFEKESRHKFMSGVGVELIFDRLKNGTMLIGFKGLPKNEWSRVVEWNLFATDGIIWVIDRPLNCPKKHCGMTKIIEKELWKVLSFACWESLRAARGARAYMLEPWLATMEGNKCFTNKNTPKKESSEHEAKESGGHK